MKGINTMTLNQATMQEAIQDWIDKRFIGKDTAKVTSVKIGGSAGRGEFEITLESNEVEK